MSFFDNFPKSDSDFSKSDSDFLSLCASWEIIFERLTTRNISITGIIPRAISSILLLSIIGALLGTNIVTITKNLVTNHLYVGSYISLSLLTVIPLFLYVRGVELCGLGPTGMIFYITPTLQFILGYFYYNEEFSFIKFVSFIIIWIAVVIYLKDLYETS